jgi:AhpD family alkylhydroperoxidase
MKLDDRIRGLIAVGTAIGANCHPCLRYHTGKARDLGIPQDEIAEAIEVGKLIRKGAQGSMDKFVNELLSENSASLPPAAAGCGCGSARTESPTPERA